MHDLLDDCGFAGIVEAAIDISKRNFTIYIDSYSIRILISLSFRRAFLRIDNILQYKLFAVDVASLPARSRDAFSRSRFNNMASRDIVSQYILLRQECKERVLRRISEVDYEDFIKSRNTSGELQGLVKLSITTSMSRSEKRSLFNDRL